MASENNVPYEGGLLPFKSRCKKVKQVLRGHQFTTDQQLKDGACVASLSAQTFDSEDIKKLVQRWTKWLEK
jgi:hypothetical protein